MRQAGIEVRPIPTMLGPHHLNEVFFDEVPVTRENLLGELHNGWSIVRETLAFERVGIARYARCEKLLTEARQALSDRCGLAAEVIAAALDAGPGAHTSGSTLAYHVIERQALGTIDPRQAASYRIAVTSLDQEAAEVLMDLVESLALGTDDREDLFIRGVDDHWRYAQASTVASGSIEMQRVLVSRSLLNGAQ